MDWAALYRVVAAGLQEAYSELKPPLDSLSYIRPVITVLYLFIAARFFMAAVKRRKGAVFGMVFLAALVATGANVLSAAAYLRWKSENSSCADAERLAKLGLNRRAESILKAFAQDNESALKNNPMWDETIRAEGRALVLSYRLKKPMDTDAFNRWVGLDQKLMRDAYCADGSWLLRTLKATETFTYYSPEGERLSSFSVAPADCPQW